jgi:hypothetical protein
MNLRDAFLAVAARARVRRRGEASSYAFLIFGPLHDPAVSESGE